MYDALSQDYDRFIKWEDRLAYELPFLEQILNSLPAPKKQKPQVLDTACGTGMHAIALAQQGYQVAGTDLSPNMIAQAKRNAEQVRVQVRFEIAGFGEQTSLFGEGSFDAVLCLGNSLPHLLSEAELLKALTDFYRLLRPSGVALIQSRNFDGIMQTRQREMDPQSVREKNQEWIFIRFYDFLENGLIQFNFLTLTRQGEGPWKQEWQCSLLRPLLAGELVALISRAGFSEVKLCGSLAGDAFAPDLSPNLVVMACKGGQFSS